MNFISSNCQSSLLLSSHLWFPQIFVSSNLKTQIFSFLKRPVPPPSLFLNLYYVCCVDLHFLLELCIDSPEKDNSLSALNFSWKKKMNWDFHFSMIVGWANQLTKWLIVYSLAIKRHYQVNTLMILYTNFAFCNQLFTKLTGCSSLRYTSHEIVNGCWTLCYCGPLHFRDSQRNELWSGKCWN